MCDNCTESTYYDASVDNCVACPNGDRYNRTGVRSGKCLNSTVDNGTTFDFWLYSTDFYSNGTEYMNSHWANCENNT